MSERTINEGNPRRWETTRGCLTILREENLHHRRGWTGVGVCIYESLCEGGPGQGALDPGVGGMGEGSLHDS